MRELRITIFNQSKGMSVGFTLTRKQMSKIKTTQSNEVQLNAPRQSSSGVTDSTNGAAKQLPIAPSEDDLLYVSDHCTATKAFRLQWEAEVNPHCRKKTTFAFGEELYVFDGFYLLFHGNKTPEEIPPFEYTRGGIMCKVYFVLEDFPLNLSTQDDISSLFSFQQYLFRQLLGIQPCHLFMASTTHKCTDYHIYPRFIAVKQKPLINRQDLDAPHRIGFCLGQLMPIPKIVEYLKATSFLSAKKILEEFDPLAVIDSIVSTRINDQPAAFRIDELVYADPSETKKNTSKNKKKRIITGLKHIGTGATTFDGVIAMKKVHQWQNMGAFLQISHEVPPTEQVLVPEECHLTGFRADIFEIGSAMPMICKFVRHYTLLQSFEQSMGIQFKDKALLRQAFTHASYVDAGMQHVNTVEATVSRVRLAHTFTSDIQQLKRLRETQVSMIQNSSPSVSGSKKIASLVAKHVSSDFRPEFHSRYNCPYERLEFLGDAVLSFLIASSSYLKLPITAREDFLHGTRVEIAKNETLGKIARHANFDSLLLSAFDLTQLEEEYKNKIVADCFEALLGALYKDSESDVTSCRTLFNKLLQSFDAELADLVLLTNEEIALKCQEVSTIDQEAISQSPSYHEILQLHEKFQLKTQIPLKNIALWLQCMTHNSFKDAEVDDPEKVFITSDPNYERIEFLGDAVLQLLSSDFLVTCLPFQQENFLTRARSSLVKNKRLAKVAFNLGFQEFIRVGKNARREAQHLHWDDVYADVFEAILGALFLENKSSLKQVNQVLKRTLFPLLEDSITRREWMNPIEVISHHMNQWNKNTMKKASCYFKKIPEMNHGGHQEDQSLHGIALYVEFGSNKFLIARARARSIATAKQLACKRALKMYGIKWLPDTLHNK